MPHPLDLTSPLKEALYSTALAPITPTLDFDVSTQTHNGTAWSGSHSQESVNMTSRLLDDGRMSVSMQKPIMPLDDGFAATEIQVTTSNADGHWSVTQTGAKVDPDRYEQAQVRLGCNVHAAGQAFRIFKGRVDGRPAENFESTTWNVRSIMLDALLQPVMFEKITGFAGQVQNSFVLDNVLVNQSVIVTDTSPAPLISKFRIYDGYVVFAEDARIISTVTNNKQDNLILTNINVKNGAFLGSYTIEFKDKYGYVVTHPDNSSLNGSIHVDFDSDYIGLSNKYWGNRNLADGTGATIEFKVCSTMSGNPVSIIMNLLEKCLANNWGSNPGFGKSGVSTTLPIDWQEFWKLERRYRRHSVFVSVTNDDNSVWRRIAGNRPLNCLSLCQRIADHIGCSIRQDLNGNITIIDRKAFDEQIHDINDSVAITDAEVIATNTENFLRVQYGQNIMGNSFGGEVEKDMRDTTADLIEERVIQLPFFKAGISDNLAFAAANYYADKLSKSTVRAVLKMTPNFIAPMLPGDRFRLITAVRPELLKYVEVSRVDKSFSANGFNPGRCEVFEIEDPAGAISDLCKYVVGDPVIC